MTINAVEFSKTEMGFIKDQEFLLTKIAIGNKVERLLGLIEQMLHQDVKSYNFPNEVLIKSGKISKGDSYQNLPYYVLDFPRKFGKEGIFAFRTMFWWGNFFSATLHMSGEYLDRHRRELIANIDNIKQSNPYVCVNKVPWEYDYGNENYLKAFDLSEDELRAMFNSNTFVKISYKWELEEYQKLPDLVQIAFNEVLNWI